ncbi:MAG: DUF354 domain-containing protein [Calditrichaeota bacterium]|nr:DUF354 domain-containing protein [Calditrichota bacterium]
MTTNNKKTIWFDFDNSPHVPVLLPIAKEMRNRGYKTFFTARDVAQTVGLLENAGEQHVVIDGIFPKSNIQKYYHTFARARHLKQVIKWVKPDCGISHCSRSGILAAWFMGIPNLTMYDYEYINNTIQNRYCSKVLIPEAVDDTAATEAGINPDNLHRYPGLKEQLYLNDFQPDPGFNDKYQIPDNGKIIVTLRPPAENSHYHNSEVEQILAALLDKLNKQKSEIFLIITPRTEKQLHFFKDYLIQHQLDGFIPRRPLPGADLIYHSDLLITGGGTMVREAAVLGVPAYTIFKGQKGAVDRFLENAQRLIFIDTPSDVNKIHLSKRKKSHHYLNGADSQLTFVCNQIENLLSEKSMQKNNLHKKQQLSLETNILNNQ